MQTPQTPQKADTKSETTADAGTKKTQGFQLHEIDAFKAFFVEFSKESERAMVVLTASRIENLLQQILGKFLIPNTSRTDDFFENQGPGSTFSNRISILYRVGVLDAEFTNTLHRIRRIRNSFAHEHTSCTLESGSHSDQVKSLCAHVRKCHSFEEFGDLFFGNIKGNKRDYMTMMAIITIRLEAIFQHLEPANAEKAATIMTEAMKEPKVTAAEEKDKKSS